MNNQTAYQIPQEVQALMYNHPTISKIKHLIQPQTDLSNVGTLLLHQSTIQQLRDRSGPLVVSNEYQTHFWALIVRVIQSDDSVLDICLPTVFFNYAQEVTGAHIDFELADVCDISEKLEPVHNVVVNKFMQSSFIANLREKLPSFTLEFLSTDMNTVHRHPGSHISQSFSGTDLSTNHLHNTGVVFPLASATNKPNFAGIMAHDKLANKIAHFEYRVADGAIDVDKQTAITYRKGRCIAYIADEPSTTSNAELLAGVEAVDTSYITTDDYPTSAVADSILADIFSLWQSDPLIPMTDFISADNVTKKQITPIFKQSSKQPVKCTNLTLEQDTYYSVGKAIKWHPKENLRRMSQPQLIKVVRELSDYYYGEDIELEHVYTTYPIFKLIEEYEQFRTLIQEELNDIKDNEDEEDVYMSNCLVQVGVDKGKLANMTSLEITRLYLETFPNQG